MLKLQCLISYEWTNLMVNNYINIDCLRFLMKFTYKEYKGL